MIILEGVSYCKDCKKTYKTTEYAKNARTAAATTPIS